MCWFTVICRDNTANWFLRASMIQTFGGHFRPALIVCASGENGCHWLGLAPPVRCWRRCTSDAPELVCRGNLPPRRSRSRRAHATSTTTTPRHDGELIPGVPLLGSRRAVALRLPTDVAADVQAVRGLESFRRSTWRLVRVPARRTAVSLGPLRSAILRALRGMKVPRLRPRPCIAPGEIQIHVSIFAHSRLCARLPAPQLSSGDWLKTARWTFGARVK